MSVFSASRSRYLLAAALLVGSALAFLPAAQAVTEDADSSAHGQRVRRVSIGSRGIVVERESGTDTLDTTRPYHLRRSFRHGWIQVDDEGDAIVRVFSDIDVPAGKRVPGDVVAVFGSVTIAGQVDGDVVAVLGSVKLEPGSGVRGDCVSIGGTVDQAEGVDVGGETVSVGVAPPSWGIPAVSITLSAVITGWLAAIFIGWLFAMLFPARLVRVATTASRRTAASLLLGIASIPLAICGVFLLFVTIVGIPLAILLPPAYLLVCFAGQLAATYVLGCKLTARRPGSGGLVLPIVAGTLMVAAFFVIGALMFSAPGITRPLALFSVLLGCLMVLGLTAIGTGAFMLSKLGAEPRDVTWSPLGTTPAAPAASLAPPTVPQV